MNEVTISSPEEFMNFVATAQPSDRAIYHTGHLSIDTDPEQSGWTDLSQMDIAVMAGLALRFEGVGAVALVQRRKGTEFDYLAVRRSRPQG